MSASGPAFYDDDAVFATYMAARQRRDNPNDTLEQPVLLELAGDLVGRRVLDLGCGDAAFGRVVLARGGSAYLGVEGSRNMAAVAREMLAGSSGQVRHCAIEDWEAPALLPRAPGCRLRSRAAARVTAAARAIRGRADLRAAQAHTAVFVSGGAPSVMDLESLYHPTAEETIMWKRWIAFFGLARRAAVNRQP